MLAGFTLQRVDGRSHHARLAGAGLAHNPGHGVAAGKDMQRRLLLLFGKAGQIGSSFSRPR